MCGRAAWRAGAAAARPPRGGGRARARDRVCLLSTQHATQGSVLINALTKSSPFLEVRKTMQFVRTDGFQSITSLLARSRAGSIFRGRSESVALTRVPRAWCGARVRLFVIPQADCGNRNNSGVVFVAQLWHDSAASKCEATDTYLNRQELTIWEDSCNLINVHLRKFWGNPKLHVDQHVLAPARYRMNDTWNRIERDGVTNCPQSCHSRTLFPIAMLVAAETCLDE
jgi:hypothetical protein